MNSLVDWVVKWLYWKFCLLWHFWEVKWVFLFFPVFAVTILSCETKTEFLCISFIIVMLSLEPYVAFTWSSAFKTTTSFIYSWSVKIIWWNETDNSIWSIWFRFSFKVLFVSMVSNSVDRCCLTFENYTRETYIV